MPSRATLSLKICDEILQSQSLTLSEVLYGLAYVLPAIGVGKRLLHLIGNLGQMQAIILSIKQDVL